MFREHTICRACGGSSLTPVFDLGVQPLANDFCRPGEPRQGCYPLCILRCPACGLAQLSATVDKDTLFRKYAYVTSTSVTMQRHFHRLFLDIFSEQPDKVICEIASNDGGCLQFAKSIGFSVLGVDPARNLATVAEGRGITTIPEFFNPASAELAKGKMPMPGVILARHVLAHVDDWGEFLKALEILATKDTLIVLEFPYVKDLLDRVEFDSVYSEHLSYISLKPLAEKFKTTPFHIHRVSKVGIHGGAIVLMLRHNDSGIQPHLSADEFLEEENITEQDWVAFSGKATRKILDLQSVVHSFVNGGEATGAPKIISAFGASAKATVLLNACKFTKKEITFVTDNSPLKPGCLLPGTDIPIIEEGQMLSEHPDYVLLTAWNYREEILAKNAKYRSRGGKFIIPGKTLEIV